MKGLEEKDREEGKAVAAGIEMATRPESADLKQEPVQLVDGNITKHKESRFIIPTPMISVNKDSKFCTNMIKTSRYTIVTFLPLSILIQFTKIANVAWLCVMILNSFPQVRVNSPLVVAVVLSIIIFIGVLKEGITDYARH